MAEAQGPDDMGEEGTPFEIDPDLIDDVDDGGIARPEPKPEKRRGRPPKHPPAPGDDTRRRAFVESNVKTTLAKQDMMEVINRYDWESGDYDVSILRVQPQSWHGRNIQGYIAAFPHAIDENFISENFGGGVYDLKIRGPNPRAGGAAKGFLDGCRVKISGEPKVNPMDKSIAFDGGGIMLNEPQAGPPSMRQMTDIQRSGQKRIIMGADASGMASTEPDPSLIKMSFNSMMAREKESAREAASLRERLIENSSKQGGGDSITREAMRLIRESADKAVEAERSAAEKIQEAEYRHREDFEKMVDRMNNQKAGIPPEMLQTLTEQHRSELAAVQESRLTQLGQAQERHERDVTNLRERYEREITVLQERSQENLNQVRGELQSRLDRQDEQFKRELERERERYQAELAKLKDDAEKRYSDLDREHKSRFDRGQEDWQRRVDQVNAQGTSDREALSRSHQMHIEHMKALHGTQVDQISTTLKSQIEQERSQRDSLMAQAKAQHESSVAQLTANYDAQLKMMETSYRSQIENLSAELGRTRSDLDTTRAKVTEQGDLASQAQKLKMIGDSLQGVFGLGGSAGALARIGDGDVEVEQRQEEPKTWFGKLMQFSNSDMGAGLFDFLKSAAGAAAVGVYPGGGIPGMPAGMQPGYMPPQGYAPPQSYGPPQGYAPSPYVAPYQQQQQVPVRPYNPAAQVGPEDEFVDEGDVEGSFVDGDAQDAEPAGPGQESPQVQAASQSSVRPEAQNVQQVSPEAMQQMKVLVKGLEESMNSGASAEALAKTISSMAPPEQLRPFVDTPLSQLMNEIAQILPGSTLATYQGRKYISALQQELRKIIG
jgi:hypothetical protein